MSSPLAVQLFARLIAHYPSLGGSDEPALQRARDWCAVIDRSDTKIAMAVCNELVEGWAERYPPRIGDWQELARQKALHMLTAPTPELMAPVADPRANALVQEAKQKLTMQRAKTQTIVASKEPRKELGPIDPEGKHVARYEDVYPPVSE